MSYLAAHGELRSLSLAWASFRLCGHFCEFSTSAWVACLFLGMGVQGWAGPRNAIHLLSPGGGPHLPPVTGHLQPAEAAPGMGCQHREGPPVPARLGLCRSHIRNSAGAATSRAPVCSCPGMSRPLKPLLLRGPFLSPLFCDMRSGSNNDTQHVTTHPWRGQSGWCPPNPGVDLLGENRHNGPFYSPSNRICETRGLQPSRDP